jgi:hypothetical protein
MPDWMKPLLDQGVLGVFVLGCLAVLSAFLLWLRAKVDDLYSTVLKPGALAHIEAVKNIGDSQASQASCMETQTEILKQIRDEQREHKRICEKSH